MIPARIAWAVAATAATLVSLSSVGRAGGPPGAAPVEQKEEPSAGGLALAAELGWITGAAVGGELRFGPLGARVTGGGNAVPILVSDPDTHTLDSFHLYATGQLNANIFLLPIRTANGAEIGMEGGYCYNTLLGGGVLVAVEARRAIKDQLTLYALFGVSYYPKGEDRAIEKKGLPPDADFSFPFGAGIQSGLNVGLTYSL